MQQNEKLLQIFVERSFFKSRVVTEKIEIVFIRRI